MSTLCLGFAYENVGMRDLLIGVLGTSEVPRHVTYRPY